MSIYVALTQNHEKDEEKKTFFSILFPFLLLSLTHSLTLLLAHFLLLLKKEFTVIYSLVWCGDDTLSKEFFNFFYERKEISKTKSSGREKKDHNCV